MELAENLERIETRIQGACQRSGRERAAVTLLAVSKTHPPETVDAAARLGIAHFGENKVQEAKAKIPNCNGRLHWHFIGHLQSNKCRDVVGLFEMVQGVDSLSIAQELSKRADQAGKTLPILLEINVAGEASKFGYSPEKMLSEVETIKALPRLELQGLMAIPPYTLQPERSRPYFRKLRELKQTTEDRLRLSLAHLSMGMSGDFEVAIEEGATIVRIGTALFGERQSTVRRESAV